MTFTEKQKTGYKKSAFKSFGNFLALHMVKRFVRKSKTNQISSEQQITEKDKEAGFNCQNFSNGTVGNGVDRNNSVTTTTSLIVHQNQNKLLNGSANVADPTKTMPGVFGLSNHGNTCFINSITQCLSNTDLLAEYFVMGQYKQDMKNCRKDRSKKYGTKGEVTEQMAVIIKSLWMGLYTSDMTKTLKELIGKHASQYKGAIQHDSQEYLLWLFDKMHEDLNMQPLKRKTFARKQSIRKNRKLAVDNPKVNLDKNISDLTCHSFIQKTFQGHYHSSLSCPTCKKKSETIDPYLCVSLPLKQRTIRPIFVNVVYLPNKRRSGSSKKNYSGRTVRIGVSVEIDGKINQLRQAVAAECGIHSRLLAFVHLQHDGFHKSYGDDKSICEIPFITTSNAENNMSFYAFEMPPVAKMTAGTLPRNFATKHKKRSFGSIKQSKEAVNNSGNALLSNTDSIVVILINKHGIKEKGKRFGRPLVFRTTRDIPKMELHCMILNQMSDHLKNGVKYDHLDSHFQLQIMDGIPNKSYLSQDVQHPLQLPVVDKALENSPAGSPLHIKLVAEWDTDVQTGIFNKFPEEKVELQDSVRLQKLIHQQPITCTLEECFDLYTEEEELGPDDGWMCPHCNKVQHGTRKKLSLYTLPDVFVLHLKRFRVESGRRTKLSTRVEFPITGLNLSKHMYNGEKECPVVKSKIHKNNYSSHKSASLASPDDTMYDLYAVCNHYGNLNSGHYTACCSNPLDGRWYLYDDEQTQCIKEDSLSSQSVYLLFYQRRSSSAALSCGGASINSVMSDHWAFSLPQIRQRIEFNSQSHLNRHSVTPNRVKPLGVSQNICSNNTTKVQPAPTSPVNTNAAMQRNMNNNSLKIAAALKERSRGNQPEDEDSDDGGFASTSRPYAKGLRRQGSAVIERSNKIGENGLHLKGREYRSYRHTRSSKSQRSSRV